MNRRIIMDSRYFKIYHYSKNNKPLEYIDPACYGTGVTGRSECKYGKQGLDKSYFYTKDEPENCVRSSAIRYEIYLPYEWKKKIYDIGFDCGPDSFFEKAK